MDIIKYILEMSNIKKEKLYKAKGVGSNIFIFLWLLDYMCFFFIASVEVTFLCSQWGIKALKLRAMSDDFYAY